MRLKEDEFQRLVDCVIFVESKFNPNAISPKGAAGLMQLMPATGKELAEELLPGRPYRPLDPDQNRFLGSTYLRRLLHRFKSTPLALAAYNWGLGNVSRLLNEFKEQLASLQVENYYETIKNRLPKETRLYVEKILSLYENSLGPYHDNKAKFAEGLPQKPQLLG